MKLLNIITGLNVGGAEIMLFELIRQMKNNHDIYIISLTDCGEIGERIKQLGCKVYSINFNNKLIDNINKIPLMVSIIKEIDPNIIHTWMYHANFIGGLICRLSGYKNIIWGIHQSDFDKKTTKIETRIIIKMCSIFSSYIPKKILFCSNNSKLLHEQYGYPIKKNVLIPNGFDYNNYYFDICGRDKIRRDIGLTENDLVVGVVARYDPQKNYKGFIDAAAIVSKSIKNVKYILVGNGIIQENDELMGYIKTNNIEGDLYLFGLRKDIKDIMSAFDIYVSSSNSGEAFPIVLGEAMLCERICVVTDVGDSKEIVGEYGFVVEKNNCALLAEKIVYALQQDYELRRMIGHNARTEIIKKYSIQKISHEHEVLYNEVM